MIVLAIDPGETTGFVLAEVVTDDRITIKESGDWSGLGAFIANMDLFAGVDVCVCEDYKIRPNRANTHIGDPLYAAQEIGRVKLMATLKGAQVVLQSASSAKQLWPGQRLDHYVNIATLKSRHTIDALRHLFTYAERQGLYRFVKAAEAL